MFSDVSFSMLSSSCRSLSDSTASGGARSLSSTELRRGSLPGEGIIASEDGQQRCQGLKSVSTFYLLHGVPALANDDNLWEHPTLGRLETSPQSL